MSAYTFIAADCPLTPLSPSKEYPPEINVDRGTIFDGDADDNFSLLPFYGYPDCTDLKHALALEWAYCTEGRAERLIEYIKEALRHTDLVELWRVWCGALDEVGERPMIKAQTVPIDALTASQIKELDSAEIWERSKGSRPTFWCIRVKKSNRSIRL